MSLSMEALRAKTPVELAGQLRELREERFWLRMQHSASQLAQWHVIKRTRRDIARVMTAISEKEILAAIEDAPAEHVDAAAAAAAAVAAEAADASADAAEAADASADAAEAVDASADAAEAVDASADAAEAVDASADAADAAPEAERAAAGERS